MVQAFYFLLIIILYFSAILYNNIKSFIIPKKNYFLQSLSQPDAFLTTHALLL